MMQIMADQATEAFLKSMTVGFEQWHDGIGYDLAALGRVPEGEREFVETWLVEHLHQKGDWRDVEALVVLGTPRALAEVRTAREHANPEVRKYVVQYLLSEEPEGAANLEDDVVRAIEGGAIEMAEQHQTPRVKQALLTLARDSDATTRVNAAAMLMYVCDLADDPFDWDQRPFFLRFGEDEAERTVAWMELKEKTGL